MSEASMSKTVMKALKPLHGVRIETTHSGFPDVSYADGLLENKYAARWPSRPTTPLKLHIQPGQKPFWSRRAAVGGRIFVLLKVGREWLLFDGATAAKLLGVGTKVDLRMFAVKRWAKKLDADELVAELGAK